MVDHRSGCPISLSLDVLGDRWSLLLLRDVTFAGKNTFRQMLRSQEGIAPNILTARLRKLVEHGLLTRHDDPGHKQKSVYRLTEAAIDLVPVFVQLGAWGTRHLPADPAMSVPSAVLSDGGPPMWARFQDELRAEHLGYRLDGRPWVADAIAHAGSTP